MNTRTAVALASSVIMAVALVAASKHLILPTVVCALVALSLGIIAIRQRGRPEL
jgi:hypothetical protein